jgi:hypothetical protein
MVRDAMRLGMRFQVADRFYRKVLKKRQPFESTIKYMAGPKGCPPVAELGRLAGNRRETIVFQLSSRER